TDWYEGATTRRIRAASCGGLSGITATIVVQLGDATMPRCAFTAWGLISGTTSGTAGSKRQALDLSTTTAPAFAIIGAYSLACAVPAEQMAISTPLKAAGSTRPTRMSSPRKLTVLPTERSEAKARSSRT